MGRVRKLGQHDPVTGLPRHPGVKGPSRRDASPTPHRTILGICPPEWQLGLSKERKNADILLRRRRKQRITAASYQESCGPT